MEHRLLASDLYDYLLSLADQLRSGGAPRMAEQVLQVSKYASGSSSEFYGESRLLLPQVLREESERLSEQHRLELREIIRAIESEFRRIGGA
jgi:hypothetical protein